MTAQSLDLDSAPPYQSLPGDIFCYGCKDPSFHYLVSCPLYPCKPLPWDRRWNDHRDIPEAAVSILTPEPPQMPSALWCLGARNFPHEQKWETFFFSIYWFQRERGRESEWERKRERERRREKHQFLVSLIYVFIDWFLYVPWPGTKPTTLVYQDNALTQLFSTYFISWHT